MGLIAGFIMPVLMRTQLILMSPFDWVKAPYRLIQAISKYKGTLSWLPNFAYNFCAQKIRDRDLETVDLSSWRAVINCSEPMYWQSHKMFLERFKPFGFRETALATCYAMAENVFAVTQAGIDTPVRIDMVDRHQLASQRIAKQITNENHAVRMVSAGKPIGNTEIKVVNAEGISLPERMVGEICLKSNCMLTGYFNRPEINEKSFLNGWYLTGDLGYLANGELYISGRKKDLIIVGGKNIYPQDLEMIASGVPGVHPGRVAAFGIYNPQVGTEEVVVISELDSIETVKKEYVFKEIQKRINQNSDISVRIVKLVHPGWLLKTSSGKVSRSANKEKYLSEFAINE